MGQSRKGRIQELEAEIEALKRTARKFARTENWKAYTDTCYAVSYLLCVLDHLNDEIKALQDLEAKLKTIGDCNASK